MKICSFDGCGIKFGLTKHKYECGICGSKFCDEHCCNNSYIEHFEGKSFYELDKVINSNGYLCQKCLIDHGPSIDGIVENIYERICHIEGCHKKLNKLLVTKSPCLSCGKIGCDDHKMDKNKVPNEWLQLHAQYPADYVCTKCISEKTALPQILRHPKALNLKLSAGDPEGENRAIVVHGILSDPSSLDWFSRSLERTDMFDSVWLYDDPSYHGSVNEAKRLGLKDIPLGLDLKVILKSLGKVAARKAYQTLDLPSYIVEGAARKLASDIRLLDWKDITLVGHSLGGLVVRCASELYELENYVNNIITLGSPFRLWMNTHSINGWKEKPNEEIKYLTLLGESDWVTTHRSWGNLTNNDEILNNAIKVIYPGLDHTGIHTQADKKYVFEFIKVFLNGELTKSKDKFYTRSNKSTQKAYMSTFHGEPVSGDSVFTWSGDWIEFEKM